MIWYETDRSLGWAHLSHPPLGLFHDGSKDVVFVEVLEAKGSVPREAGAWMLVNERGDTYRTIGGGRLEHEAVQTALRIIARDDTIEDPYDHTVAVALGPEIGQCCGGHVTLRFEYSHDIDRDTWIIDREDEELVKCPHVLIFGNGHVGAALAKTLRDRPLAVKVVDTRPDFGGEGVTVTPLPEQVIDAAPPASAFVVLTHDHALDYLLVDRALARGDARYVGLIGSATKRATFAARMRRDGHPPERFEAVTCPIAADAPPDKRPEVIALFAAAEVAGVLLSDGAV